MIKFLLTVAALVMASAVPADAGPVFFAVLAGGGTFGAAFGATAFGSFLTTTMLGRLLTSVALGALKQVLAPKSKSGQSSGIQTNITQTGADQPVSWVMGKYATAGVMVCPPMTHGKFGKTPNAYLTYVVNLSDIPGMTLNRVAINGVWVTYSGAADPNYGTPATGDYAGYAWLKYYNGSQVAADPMLLSKYGSYPDRPWSSDMIGRDTCYAILTFRVRQQLYSGFPTVLFEVSGIPLYDPRKDTSVGGSGAHRWANKATWEPSNNPFVQIYNIMRGIQITSTEAWGGRATASDVPLSTWFTAMNACDAATPLAAGGTEPMYRSGIEVFGNDEPASVIEELLKAAAGDLCDIGGIWKARAGGVALPVYMFTDDDVIITQSGTFDPFPAGLSGVYNAAVATYPEPISTYETETSPQMLFADYEAQDRGQRLPASLSLPSVPYTNQVQRLCDGYVRDNRKFRRHSVPMPPQAMLLEPLDATAWTSDRNGYVGKVFEVEEIRDDIMSGLQGVSMRERDPADYSWVPSRELPTEPLPFTLVLPVAQGVPSWTVTGVSLIDAASNARRPALRLTWDGAEQDSIAGIEWEIRLTGTVNVQHRGNTTLLDTGVFDYSAGILPNTAYETRGRFLSANARDWTAWTAATTPDTGFTNEDFGTAGAYETLFTDFGLYAIRDVTSLPGSGAFVGEKVFNRTDGKLYQWTGTVWQLMVADVAAGTVTTASFAAGITPVEILAALPTTGNFEGRLVYLTTDNKLYRHTGSPTGSAGFTKVTDGADISPATLTAAAFASTIAPVEIVATLPTTGNFAGRTVFLTSDSKMYRHTGSPVGSSGFTVATDGADIVANSITAGQIAAGAIGATEVAAGAILASKIVVSDFANIYPDFDILDPLFYASTTAAVYSFVGNNGVNGGRQLLEMAVSAASESVESNWFTVEHSTEYLVAGAAYLATAGVGAGTMTLSIETGSMDSAGVITGLTSDVVQTNTNSASSATGSITLVTGSSARRARFVATRAAGGSQAGRTFGFKVQKKGTGALTVDGTITGTKIAAGTITAGNIAADTITAGVIAAGAIGASEIAAGAIIAGKIAAGTIVAADIAAGTITGDRIVANTITGGLLATSGIITNTAQINNLMVTGAKIANLAVDTLQIAGNAVTTMVRFIENAVRSLTSDVTWVEIGRITINRTTGNKTDFNISVLFDGYGNGLLQLGLFRGVAATTPILTAVGNTMGGRQNSCTYSGVDLDTAAGSTVYILKARKVTAANTGGWNANLRVHRSYIAAQQFKK